MEQMSLLPPPRPDVVFDPVNLREEIEQRVLTIRYIVQDLPLDATQRHIVCLYALGMGRAFQAPTDGDGRWIRTLVFRALGAFLPRGQPLTPEVQARIRPFHEAGRLDAVASFKDRDAWRRFPTLEAWIQTLDRRTH